MIKSILKALWIAMIQIIQPFKWLAKSFYQILKAVFVPLYKGVKAILQALYRTIKWVSLGIYQIVIQPMYWVLKKLFYGLYQMIRLTSRLLYTYLIYPIYWVLKQLYQGLSIVIKQISRFIWIVFLKPLFRVLKWIAHGLIAFTKKIYQVLQYLSNGFKQIALWFAKVAIAIWSKIKPIIVWVLTQFWQVFKWIGQGFKAVFTIIRFLWIGLYERLSKLLTLVIEGFKLLIQGIQWLINQLVFLYRNMPEGLYLSLKWVMTMGYLLLVDLLYTLPKAILWDLPVIIVKRVFKAFKAAFIFTLDVIQRLLVRISNGITHLKYALNPLNRVLLDAVYDFKDYYYILLLLPILLPIFLLIGLLVTVELVFVHLYLMLKAIFSTPKIVIRKPYLPAFNLCVFSRYWIQKVYRNLGYQRSWQNTHSLMMTILWPLFWPLRLILSVLLLPFTVLPLFFYGLKYFANKDQLEAIIGDFISLKNEYEGFIESKPISLYGHQVKLEIPKAYYDAQSGVFVYEADEVLHVHITIDDVIVHRQSMVYQTHPKAQLLVGYLKIQAVLQQNNQPYFELPQLDDLEVTYQKTHQADTLFNHQVQVRDYSNTTDIMVKLKTAAGLSYERSLSIVTINTITLERLLETSNPVVFQGQSIFALLDPKLKYRWIENPHIDQNRVKSTASNFEVKFVVIGLDTEYALNVRLWPNPFAHFVDQKAILKPIYDKTSQRYQVQNQAIMNQLIQTVAWTVDDVVVEASIGLDELSIQPNHVFTGQVFDGQLGHQRTFIIPDPRYSRAVWSMALEAIRQDLQQRLESNPDYKHLRLPWIRFNAMKCLLFKSLNPNQVKSTGLILKPGITTFEVTLYQHIWSKRTIQIQLNH